MGADEDNVPTRLIICVDGSQYNPSSSSDVETNIHRIYASVPVGRSVDSAHGAVFKHEVKYVPGIGSAEDAFSKDRIQASVLGGGHLKQIQDVYESCCRLSGERDEVWLFGFSRGAFVVRAVAGLLHNFGALASAGSSEFSKDFRKIVKEAESSQGKQSDSISPVTSVSSFKTTTAPRIQFVGVFDTIKAVSDSSSLDISFNRSIRHMRHAVALHEDRKALSPEYLYPEELYGTSLKDYGRSFVQAHFIGQHADMGGSAKKSGLALYPLQWMLLEAKQCGLTIDISPDPGDSNAGLSVVFPRRGTDAKVDQGEQLWMFITENGIEVKMQDLRQVHGLSRNNEKRFAVKLSSSRLGSIRQKKTRDPFTDEGLLRGYCDWAPQGNIIHPSVYLLLDEHINVALETKEVKLQRYIEDWRPKMIGAQEGGATEDFWAEDEDESAANPGAIRVLVCGNTGVGKSTLINKTFGVDVTQSSHRSRGIHDVREEITWEGRPDLIVHDSGGFEAGTDDEFQAIESFLKEKSEAEDLLARVHVIWFCIDINSPRTLQTATEKLFKACSQYAQEIPIVVVATKKDDFLDIEFGVRRKMMKKEGLKFDEEACEQYAEEQLQERIDVIRAEMESVPGGRLDACLAVSQDDADSIANLSKTTSHCFDTDKVRLLYIRAQVTRIDLKVELASAEIMRRYRRLVKRVSGNFGFGGSTIVRKLSTYLVTKAVINCFGLPTVSADVAMEALNANVWKQRGANIQLALAETLSLVGIAGSVAAAGAPVWLLTGMINATYVMPTTCRLYLIMACDLTFVLARSFKEVTFRASGQPNEKDVGAAARNYAVRGYCQHVHRDIKALIPRKKPHVVFKVNSIQQGVEDIFSTYKDKLMEDVDLPIHVQGAETGSKVNDDDDTSTDGDSSLMSDWKEARAALAELEAKETPAVAELDGSAPLVELPADGKIVELEGTSTGTKPAELDGTSSTKHLTELEGSKAYGKM